MGLITRFYGPNRKGSELTIKEMDDNLYYLQSIGVDSISYSSNTLTLTNPTGGTLTTTIETSSEFTGNTSGNCITDLYVTNLYGCSPITLNNNIQYKTSSASGEYSFAEGFQTTAGIQTNERITVLSALTINWFLEPKLGGYIPYVSGTCDQLSGLTEQIEFTSDCLSDNGESTIVNLTLSGGVDDETIYTTDYQNMPCDTKFVEGIKFLPNKSFVYTGGTGYTTANLEIITVCEQLGVNYCHSEGINTSAIGDGSHAEGGETRASGNYSHAEGYKTLASGFGSHAEGVGGLAIPTIASGSGSHAEGQQTTASGQASHSEGSETTASGSYSHAEGERTTASGTRSHAEGGNTIASGDYSHSEGNGTTASGNYSHAEGYDTIASGIRSHAEGNQTRSVGFSSHAEGTITFSIGDSSHAEGSSTTASGNFSHAEGLITIASGYTSHAEGANTIASGSYSHAEGERTTASGNRSHAEGGNTIASGDYSHAGGTNSTVSGAFSFIHSNNSVLTGDRSVLIGGQNLTGDADDTVYVPYLNINNLGVGTPINNLGIDSNGNVVTGSASETVNYSNVVFVDAINGDDFTGEVNNFLKPFSNVDDALTAANNVVGKSSTNRSLVYIRRGLYINSGILVFRDNVDVYCEPGVVFTGLVQLRGASDVTSKFLGYASFQSTTLSGSINGIIELVSIDNFFIDIEFDNIISNQTAIRISSNLSLNHQINISCNYIDTNSFNAQGVNLRNNINLNLNAKQYIKGMYKTIDIRNHTGNIKIDTPKIILKEGNIYGKSGDFKQALFVNGAGGTDNYTKINADIIVEDPIRYGGITSAVRYWSSPNANIEINGNIEAGVLDAIVLSNGSGSLRFNGTIKTNRGAILSYGSNKVFVNNSAILRETDTFASPFSVGGSSEVFVNNTLYYSAFYGNLINFDSSTAQLYLTNFTAEGFTPPVDEVLTISLIDGGTGYTTDTNVTVTGGTGSGFLVDIEADINGVVTGTTISDGGTGYTVGDVLTIIGGNNDAQIQVDSISTVGTFINVGATTPTIGLNNVVTNRSYDNAIVTSYLINLTENPNIIIPKFI